MMKRFFFSAALAAALSLSALAAAPVDRAVAEALQKELAKKDKFDAVQIRIEDRVATLTGTVTSYLDKVDAEKKARKFKALSRVENRIQVAGETVADQQLFQKLARKLAYDRSFQGNVFDSFALEVRNGVVVLEGYAHDYNALNSALANIASQKGVKGVVNRAQVLPASFYDDDIRIRAARALYGHSVLSRYAMNPSHPIRIVVNRGNLLLEGTVATSMEKNVAGIVASGVPGVFSVQNNLQVENERIG